MPHPSGQDCIRSHQQRNCAKTQHANENKERWSKRKRQSELLSCGTQTTRTKKKRTTLIPTINPRMRNNIFILPTLSLWTLGASPKREARKKFFIDISSFPRARSNNSSFGAFPLNLKRVHEARSAENFFSPAFPVNLRRGHEARSAKNFFFAFLPRWTFPGGRGHGPAQRKTKKKRFATQP